MEEQASAEEGTPRSGLIDRWLATRTADDDITAVDPVQPDPTLARPSALSRLAERRAQRGGKQRDFAAEIVGAINQPDIAEVSNVEVDGPIEPAEPRTPTAEVPTPADDPTVGRLSLAGLRARRKESGFDPLNTRISVLEEPSPAFSAEASSVANADEATGAAPTVPAVERDSVRLTDDYAPTAADVAAPDVAAVNEAAVNETVTESAAEAFIAAPEARAAGHAEETAEAHPESAPPQPNPELDLQAATAALAGAVPARDERAERLARMVRMRRGAAETEQQPDGDAVSEEPPAPIDAASAPTAVPLPEVTAPKLTDTDPTAPELTAPELTDTDPTPADVAASDLAGPDLAAPELQTPDVAVPAVAAEPVLNFDAPEIPDGVDVFASLRETVKEAPKATRADPIDVLAALRDLPLTSARAAQEAQEAESPQQPSERAADLGDATAPNLSDLPTATDPDVSALVAPTPRTTTPHDPPHHGGIHAADPDAESVDPPEDEQAGAPADADRPVSTVEQPTRAGKRRAATSPDDPPPNPAADDAIMALALEAVLRAEGRDASAAPTAPATGKTSSPTTPREKGRATAARAAEASTPDPRADARPSAKPAPASQAPRPYEGIDEDESIVRKHRPPARSGVPTGGVPALVEFAPQRSTQHLLAMFMFLSLVATVGTGYLAYDSRAITEIAIAAFCGVLTLILWSAHSTAAPARIKIVNGTLEVRSKDSHHRFDLTSPYTDLVTAGTPGRRNWKVSIARKSMRAFVIDSTMVDGREFMPVLEACQAEARRRATESDRRRHGQ
ncbi:hypothetical protein ACLM5J_02195 [Nocardioides sp. Bht2]|uniref:hypothetical protein n=1 Tax=Nocardioides sp. Bht2 TaxID=3392297 RepID=UPI0039B4BCC2